MYALTLANINLRRLRNHGHFNFFKQLLTLFNEAEDVKTAIQTEFDVWHECYCQEDDALKKIKKSTYTDSIRAIDHERDTAFRGMCDINRAMLNYFDPETAEAARKVQIVLDTYGNITRLPIDEKTSAIYNFVDELEKNYNAETRKVGLHVWAEELLRRNNVFDELSINRYHETAGRTNMALKNIRANVDDAYRVMMLCIEALWVMSRDPETKAMFADFISLVNAHITHYNNILARRTSSSGKSEDAEETDDNGEQPQPTE